MVHKLIQVGIAASSNPKPLPKAVEKTIKFARKLAKYRNEVVLLTGGGGGLMTIASREFGRNGGIVVGFVPLEMEHVTVGHPRWHPYNTIEILSSSSFQARSVPMVRSSDVLVCLGGEAGTLIEVLIAYLNAKPVIVITDTGYLTDKLQLLVNREGYIDSRKTAKIVFEKDPEKAAEKAYKLGKRYLGEKQGKI